VTPEQRAKIEARVNMLEKALEFLKQPLSLFFIMTPLAFIMIITNIIWNWVTPESKHYKLVMYFWITMFLACILQVYGVIHF
jgi:hypothetical protein